MSPVQCAICDTQLTMARFLECRDKLKMPQRDFCDLECGASLALVVASSLAPLYILGRK
jgi:hypothetical protein